MPSQNTNRLATRCIHAGEKLDGMGAILYTRYGLNPTIRSIEIPLRSHGIRIAHGALIGLVRKGGDW